jgi:hypothetical protein
VSKEKREERELGETTITGIVTEIRGEALA